jgi:hypothetical protein
MPILCDFLEMGEAVRARVARLPVWEGNRPVESVSGPAEVVVPAGAVHFDGADEETIILGVASGVWATRYEDGSAGSAGTPTSP